VSLPLYSLTRKEHMQLSRDEWHEALTVPPNYDVDDFSVGRIQVIGRTAESDEVEAVLNVIRVEGTHNGTNLDVVLTLRIPDYEVFQFAEAIAALKDCLEDG